MLGFRSGDALLVKRASGRLWAIAGFLLAVACGGGGGAGAGGCGGGCGGGCPAAPYPDSAPAVENGIQVRVSEPGLTFLEDNASALAGELLDGGLTFCLPEGDDPVSLCDRRTCPSSGETGCELSMELLDVTIDAVEPDRVAVTAIIGGLDQETDFIDVNLLSSCIVRLGTQNDAGLPATIFADMKVDPRTRDVTIDLDEENIEIDFSRIELEIDAREFLDIFICETIDLIASIGFVRDLLFDNLAGPLLGTVTELTDQFLCRACESNGDCPQGSSCVEGEDLKLCIDGNSGECVPAVLGLESLVDFGSLLAGVSPGLEAEIALQVKAHGYADVIADGISIGMKGGMGGEKADCVPAVAPPSQDPVPQSQTLRSNVSPRGDEFHIGLGISKAFMDTSLWGIFNGGGLCLAIGTNTIDLLSSGTFATLLPSLRDLTRNQNTPFTLQMAPNEPPTMDLGLGEIDPETGELIDPLMTLQWKNLDMNFYSFFDDRLVRIMTLNVDMSVPLGLTVTDGGIVPVIGDLTEAFGRVDVRHSELLIEEEAFLQGLLPSLVGVALPLLGESLLNPIELPEFSGFKLDLNSNSLMGMEDNTMLGLFANLSLATEGMEQRTPKLETRVELLELLQPDESLLTPTPGGDEQQRLEKLMAQRPVATLEMSASLWGERLSDGEASFSYRLNGGIWSTHRTNPTLIIDDPSLLLQGEHTLEVRARLVDQWQTLDPTPASVTMRIDFEAPRVSLRLVDTGVAVTAFDAASPAHTLDHRVRVNGGQWSEWAGGLDLSNEALAPFGPVAVVDVQVRDEAGHTASVTRSFPIHGRVTNTNPDDGCECASVSRPGGSAGLWWLLVVGLAFVFRPRKTRRQAKGGRLWPTLLVLLVGCFALACSDDKPGAGILQQGCPEGCEEGQVCVESVCVGGCEGALDCPEGQVCMDGVCGEGTSCGADTDCSALDCGATSPICDGGECACAAPCADGCGVSEFCCELRNECTPLPDPCAEADCEEGFRGEPVSSGEGDPKTCQITGAQCDCVELDPLPEGDIGRFFDATVAGDKVVVSAYNETYGDLMVGVLGDDDAFDWTFVDGVPESGPINGSLNGPRGGLAARGDNVGLYTSIAADAGGNLHITYRDETNEALKYAFGRAQGDSWSFTTHTVDAQGSAGLWSDLSIGADGFVAMAYMSKNVPVEDASRPVATSKLRWAQANNAEPGGEGWTFTDLDTQEVDFACNGGCPTGQKCRADSNVCERTVAASRCDDACAEGESCFEEGCLATLSQPAVVSLPEGTGLFARVARFSNGDPAVVYYHRSGGDLMYLRGQEGAFTAPVILDGRDQEGEDVTDAGTFCDIAIDAQDNVHISYVDAVTDDLRYIDLSSNLSELVDDGVRIVDSGVAVSLVGDASSIIEGPDGGLRIAYQDATQHLLMLARRSEGNWQVLKVAGGSEPYTGAYGFYNRQLLVNGQSMIITYRYQRQTAPATNGLTVHRF